MSDVEERQNHGGCHRLIPRTGDILGGMTPHGGRARSTLRKVSRGFLGSG